MGDRKQRNRNEQRAARATAQALDINYTAALRLVRDGRVSVKFLSDGTTTVEPIGG